MATVFWESYGIIFADYLEKSKTINGVCYSGLVQHLDQEIKNNRPHLAEKKILFHQDNGPLHRSAIAMAKLQELKYKLIPHSSYLLDSALCDFFLFTKLKE